MCRYPEHLKNLKTRLATTKKALRQDLQNIPKKNVTRKLGPPNMETMIKEIRREMEELKRTREGNKEANLIESLDKPMKEQVQSTNPPRKF